MRASVLFRIDCDPPARLWSGVGDLVIPADAVEASPALYLGGGELVSIPDLEQALNASAARVEITVSGVAAATLALAREEAESVKGATAAVGLVHFGDDLAIAEVEWLGELRCDSLTTANEPSENGRTRSITLSMGTEDTDRSNAPAAYFTDADQRLRSPTDKIFDRIAGIAAGTSRRFGPR